MAQKIKPSTIKKMARDWHGRTFELGRAFSKMLDSGEVPAGYTSMWDWVVNELNIGKRAGQYWKETYEMHSALGYSDASTKKVLAHIGWTKTRHLYFWMLHTGNYLKVSELMAYRKISTVKCKRLAKESKSKLPAKIIETLTIGMDKKTKAKAYRLLEAFGMSHNGSKKVHVSESFSALIDSIELEEFI